MGSDNEYEMQCEWRKPINKVIRHDNGFITIHSENGTVIYHEEYINTLLYGTPEELHKLIQS